MKSIFDLTDKVALVTGASSGIGQRQAYALAMAGASVVSLGRRREQLASTVAAIEANAGKGAFLAADLTDCDLLSDVAKQASESFGAIDILINAAGVNLRQPADEIMLESWDETINLNLSVPFFSRVSWCQECKPKAGGASSISLLCNQPEPLPMVLLTVSPKVVSPN
ncbi:MAG: NADP-dependent 3-hydroxy acid dehydrogenase YdfG [Porticoccaceae bacterium]|jgi:NADP-dependent 3-hydroxy acid dehydrogenase YdfG